LWRFFRLCLSVCMISRRSAGRSFKPYLG
jgi:hypothetical protein